MTDNANSRPSAWVARFAGLVPAETAVLDVACGTGRHTRLFAAAGHPVTAVDRDVSRLDLTTGAGDVEIIEADLEGPEGWPFGDRQFGGVVVTNYLHRPLFADLVASLQAGGVLIYETFAAGNERFGKPSRAEFLLRPGELLDAVHDKLHVVAYETGRTDDPRPAIVQRICAIRAPIVPVKI